MGSYLDVADNVARVVMEEVKDFIKKKYRKDDEAMSEIEDRVRKAVAEEIKGFVGP